MTNVEFDFETLFRIWFSSVNGNVQQVCLTYLKFIYFFLFMLNWKKKTIPTLSSLSAIFLQRDEKN